MLDGSRPVQAFQTTGEKHQLKRSEIDNAGYSLWDKLVYEDSIRLLRLSRDQSTGILQFALSEYDHTNTPRYVAISYVWGKEGNLGVIENERGCYPLRRNLLALLNSVESRMSKGELARNIYLWIDALCIDQNSVSEKEQQVQRIGKTFKDAEQVWVWLGTHQDRGTSCLEMLCGDEKSSLPGTRVDTHDYWKRVWIVQEYILAKDLILFDHKCWLSGEKLLERIPKDIEKPFRSDDNNADDIDIDALYSSSMIHIVNSRRAVRLYSLSTPDSLLQLITAFGELHCTDPRDKLYALLAIYTGDLNIKVDYKISAACIFWRIAFLEDMERDWSDYHDFLHALHLNLCDLIPSSNVMQHPQTTFYPVRKCQRITDEEWKEDLILNSQDFVRLRFACNPVTPEMLLILKKPLHGSQASYVPSQYDDIPGYKILCGDAEEGDLSIRSVGAEFALILNTWTLASRDVWEMQVGAITAPASWKPSARTNLSSPSLLKLLSCKVYAEICEDERNLVVSVKRTDFVSMLVLDSDLRETRSSCCTIIHRD